MTAIFFAIATTFIDSGFGSALIQKKDRNEIDYSTCFYFNILVGIVIYAILWFASPVIADFYRTPILCDVTRVLGLTMLVNSLTISQTAKMARRDEVQRNGYYINCYATLNWNNWLVSCL